MFASSTIFMIVLSWQAGAPGSIVGGDYTLDSSKSSTLPELKVTKRGQVHLDSGYICLGSMWRRARFQDHSALQHLDPLESMIVQTLVSEPVSTFYSPDDTSRENELVLSGIDKTHISVDLANV